MLILEGRHTISFTNLARTLGMVIFEGRHTSSFAATVIIAIQNTLAKSFTCLTQTGIFVISIRIILTIINMLLICDSYLRYRSRSGYRTLDSPQCNPDDMDKLNQYINLKLKAIRVLTVTTDSPCSIAFQDTFRRATSRYTIQEFIVTF